MADPKAIQFVEGIYSRVDTQIRDVVGSLLPPVSVSAQDDGEVVSNQHRILNFIGSGVTVSNDPNMNRVNVFIPGAAVTTSATTFVSTAGIEKVLLLTSGLISGAPANWEQPSFNDSSWSASVLMTVNISANYTPVASTSWISNTAGSVTVPAGCLMRRTFTLPAGTITSATLELNIDDNAGPEKGVYLNGTYIGGGFNRGTTLPIGPATMTISPSLLTAGASNLLALHIDDTNTVGTSPHSASYRLTVTQSTPGANVQILSASAASVSFSSLPQTFTTLRLNWQAQSDQTTAQALGMRLNGDTGNNYSWAALSITSGAGSAFGAGSVSSLRIGAVGASTSSPGAAGGTVVIPNYSGSTFRKQVVFHSALSPGGIASQPGGGEWSNTSAITSVTIIPATGNLVAGSAFQLQLE